MDLATRKRIVELLTSQAREYAEKVNSFGTVAYNVETDQMEDLTKREEEHEDIFFATMQAIDALGEIGSIDVVSDLITLAQNGLDAHQKAVGLTLMQKRVDNARKQQDKDAERRYNIEASTHFEAIRRWMALENMLLKSIGNLGLRAGEGSEQFSQANRFLNNVMLNYQATGEAYYWVRQQAAYRLKDYMTQETMDALALANDPTRPEGQPPHPDTVFISLNLEAANPHSLTIGLAAGMSALHLHRVTANREVKRNPQDFDFGQKKNRFVRLVGVLDALLDEEVNNETRIKILDQIGAIQYNQTALAANFMLDALEEMIKGARDKDSALFISDQQSANLADPHLRPAALRAFVRIGRAIQERLAQVNEPLHAQLKENLDNLENMGEGHKEFDLTIFRVTGRQLHVTLGNLHRLTELKSFDEGEEYLNLNRKIVIGSGGGASVAMSGVIDRITTEPALSIIGTTDNGGATLLVRAFEAIRNGIFTGGFGDHVRFDYEAAVLEGAPGALIVRSLLNHRFGSGTKSLVEEIKDQYPDKKKKAKQSGAKEEEQFEKTYQELLKIAEKVDQIGLSGDYNSMKNMIFMGLLHTTEGMDEEFMNPDGIYAAFEAFRRLLGAKSMAVPDNPIGNEMVVNTANGEEFIGQSYYSHTPKGYSGGRERSVLKMKDIRNYYPEVAIRSRIMGLVKRAKMLIIGLGSWATSVGILLKKSPLVNAITENKDADKILITNPVRDDETRGMSWRESSVTFLRRIMGRNIYEVFNRVLANSNGRLDRDILPARPNLGKVRQVYDGYFGGYAGENTAGPDDISYLTQNGVTVVSDLEMATVQLSPQRMNPDLYNANIQYVPELFAEGLWRLISAGTRKALTPRNEVEIIQRKDEIKNLLKGKGLTLLSLGLHDIHEVIFHPRLVQDFRHWLNEGTVPDWIENKRDEETMFQYVVRRAIETATGTNDIASQAILLGDEIPVRGIDGVNLRLKFLGVTETDQLFPASRISLVGDSKNLSEEGMHRLGIIKIPPTGHTVTIELPYELLELGSTPQEKIERIQAVVSFQLEKARRLIEHGLTGEQTAHQEALQSFESQEEKRNLLAETSAGVPLVRFLRKATVNGKIPNFMFDMDGTFTAAGTPLTPEMAFDAWQFFRSKGILKTVMTAQQFEGPLKQIFDEVEQTQRVVKWSEVRTGVKRAEIGAAHIWDEVTVGVSSGGGVYSFDRNKDGFKKKRQESMDQFTVSLIELAARVTMPPMPTAAYQVDGHQVELREPFVQKDGTALYAAMAIIPSGRYDTKRNWDLPPLALQRNLQANRMATLLEDPESLLKEVALFIRAGKSKEWNVKIGDENLAVLQSQYEEIEKVYQQIQALLRHDTALSDRLSRPIRISSQPGGATTLDIAPEGKGPRIPIVVDSINNDQRRRITEAEKAVKTVDHARPDSKGERIPMVEDVIEESTGLEPSKMAIAFLGDEMSTKAIRAGGKEISAVGNDYTVAEEVDSGHIEIDLLLHVGPSGQGVKTLENTTTVYGEEAIMPNIVDHILAYGVSSVQRGNAYKFINTNESTRGDINRALKGRSLKAFGIESFETMNERQAQELSVTVRDVDVDPRGDLAIEGLPRPNAGISSTGDMSEEYHDFVNVTKIANARSKLLVQKGRKGDVELDQDIDSIIELASNNLREAIDLTSGLTIDLDLPNGLGAINISAELKDVNIVLAEAEPRDRNWEGHAGARRNVIYIITQKDFANIPIDELAQLLTEEIVELRIKQKTLQRNQEWTVTLAQEADEIAKTAVRKIKSTLESQQRADSPVGGIDFNPAMLDLQIKRDGSGIPLPMFQQPVHDMKIDGFLPVIINVTPVSIPLLLGVVKNEDRQLTSIR